MGANFQVSTMIAKTEKELEQNWNERIEADLYENGHDSYSGGIGTMGKGLSISKQVFTTYDAAEKAIDERAEKWSPAIAVKMNLDAKEIRKCTEMLAKYNPEAAKKRRAAMRKAAKAGNLYLVGGLCAE